MGSEKSCRVACCRVVSCRLCVNWPSDVVSYCRSVAVSLEKTQTLYAYLGQGSVTVSMENTNTLAYNRHTYIGKGNVVAPVSKHAFSIKSPEYLVVPPLVQNILRNYFFVTADAVRLFYSQIKCWHNCYYNTVGLS